MVRQLLVQAKQIPFFGEIFYPGIPPGWTADCTYFRRANPAVFENKPQFSLSGRENRGKPLEPKVLHIARYRAPETTIAGALRIYVRDCARLRVERLFS
jgi:hypothetical protein